MASENRINTIAEAHQYLRDAGEVTYSYEISETITKDHGDMFEIYLCHKKRNELTSAILVLKENGKIIPTGTDTSASYYIDEVRAGRWGEEPEFDERDLIKPGSEPVYDGEAEIDWDSIEDPDR